MKNKAIVAGGAGVALLAVALVGGAAVSGFKTKQALQAAPQAWPMVKVLEQHYDQGLFASTQTVTLQFGCAAAPGKDGAALPAVTLRQRIQHGPLPGFAGVGAAVIDTELVLPEGARKALVPLLGEQSPLTAHTTVGFDGATHSVVAMPAFQFKGPKGEQIAFQGLQAEIRQSGSATRYEMTMPGLSLAGRDERAGVELKLAGFKARGETSGTGSLYVRPGKGEAEIAAFEFAASNSATPAMPAVRLALNQLKFASDSALDKDLLAGSGRMTAQGSIGSVKLDKIELLASFKRFHAPTYEKLMQRFVDSADTCDPRAAANPLLLLSQLQQDLAGLLPFGPEYSLDKLALDIDGKHGELSYSVGVDGVTPAELQAPLPALLMSKAKFKGQAKLPALWIERAAASFGAAQQDAAAQAEMTQLMLTKAAGDGYIVRDGEMLSTQVSFEGGVLSVNGKPLGRPQ